MTCGFKNYVLYIKILLLKICKVNKNMHGILFNKFEDGELLFRIMKNFSARD